MKNTKQNPPTVTRKRRRLSITRKDVSAICRLVAKRLTETEAAECLGLRARSWFQWKHRHANQAAYESLLTRARAKYLAANLAQIEKAAAGKDGVRHDWRAADRLNAIVAPERYSQQPPTEPGAGQPCISLSVITGWWNATETTKAAVANAPKRRALPEPQIKVPFAPPPGSSYLDTDEPIGDSESQPSAPRAPEGQE